MVERIGICNENLKEDDELEMLLGEIPHATSSSSHTHLRNNHQSHINDNGYSSVVSPTMNGLMYGMYHENSSCSYKQNSVLPNLCLRMKTDENLGNNLVNYSKPLSDYAVVESHSSRNPNFEGEMSPIFGLQHRNGFSGLQIPKNVCPQSNFKRNLSNIRYPIRYQSQIPVLDLAVSDHLYHAQQYGMLETNVDRLIIQGESVNHVRNEGFRGQNMKCNHSRFTGACENGRILIKNKSFWTPVRCKTLADVKGYIYIFAKEQNGCRFIQSVFDEKNQKHVEIVFNETIRHVNELMVNPFGNYLMQKLFEVCTEEQRMCVLMEVTREPRNLVHISLNTHGTRAVQKLIETLKIRKQVKMVISALEPGFLALIKDLNGNHVIQRCLQCLSNEDNKFIFEAAAKYCVDIATHQHGCCVLQRCINHSTGEHQERLILELSSNGLLLAQDAFGNYVVQSILELQNPSAVSILTSQFEGNYVQLATQKFSSHVVEKCLLVLDDHLRTGIIRELLSSTHFEQLLQDPHANYVVQTALRVSEDSVHNLLVKAIESHKAISRNSPYSKRIFSHKLLKK
ncbi:hypothetical protein E3N88_27955 [Mikania micrantha]|uniref:PUM-HD domain-containing protein n=1 Tax=Mikania micrantha TaxID=192012 RepID=A0A5N6MZQ2_9ASTR|nr:hypothetical protein E3N88_27955 [Mikania micrantha]